MTVRPQDLDRELARRLAPVYLVCGDETLLIEEACDAIIARARSDGFGERVVLGNQSDFDWGSLAQEAGSLSLFAERRILDVRVPPKKLDKDAGEAIAGYLDRATADTVLLIRSERLETRQRKAAWFTRIEREGVALVAWPVKPDELPGFIRARCRKAGIALDADALSFLCESIEGNLLAAVQEIEKVRLLSLPQPITAEALRASVLDASHFETFDLVDAVFAGDGARIHRILVGLRAAGEQPLAILGLLVSWVRRMLAGALGGMPPARMRLVQETRRRLSDTDLEQLLRMAMHIDGQVKGVHPGEAWDTLERMALTFGGVRM